MAADGASKIPGLEDLEALMNRTIAASTWSEPSVEESPHVQLARWSILRVPPEGDLHFVGWNREGEGRMSSAVVAFDSATRRGRTKSGRTYELIGKPGWDTDAEYVANIWLRRRGCSDQAHSLRLPATEIELFLGTCLP